MRTYYLHVLIIGLIACCLSGLWQPTTAAPPDVEPAVATSIFLPRVQSQSASAGILGIEVGSPNPAIHGPALQELQPAWIRLNRLSWRAVEPVEGAGYNWAAPEVRALEAQLQWASQRNFRTILIVGDSPTWAVAPYTSNCAPINADKQQRFSDFLAAAVARYSQPPFNVLFWEIGNEPDAPIFPNDSVFGCWGLPGDPFFGGRQYGEMLLRVYPVMKAANPQVQVLNGGLLLDRAYDPSRPDSVPALFLTGMLESGAGTAFDWLSFHSYSFYDGTANGTMGSNDWKVAYLRAILQNYGVDKPLMNTESALLCWNPGADCQAAQADFIARQHARALRDNLAAYIWYVFENDSFRHTALFEPGNPTILRPAYHAFRHSSWMLNHATYLGPVAGLPAAAEGYHFLRGNAILTVVWTNDASEHSIVVPPGAPATCTDGSGAAVLCSAEAGGIRITARSNPTFILATTPAP